jgi:NAD-dependent oxidoreductase involved in siderophore biosynthesis
MNQQTKIGKTELNDTTKFLGEMTEASHAEWGEKLSKYREYQFNMNEDDLREFVHDYVSTQVLFEILDTLKRQLRGEGPKRFEEGVHQSMTRLTAIAIIHGLTLGLELQRRYGEKV